MKLRTSDVLRISVLATLLCAGGLALASSGAFGLGNTRSEQFGLAVSQILARANDGATVAQVNGLAISQRHLDIAITTRRFNGQSTDRATVLQTLITEQLVLSEALRQGITVSGAELNAFVATQRDAANQDADRHFYGYAAGLGQSETSIWSYRPLLEEWRRHLVIGKLKHAILGDVTQQTLNAKEAQWATYVAGLRASGQVVVK